MPTETTENAPLQAAPKTNRQLELEKARAFVETLTEWRLSSRGSLSQLKRNVGEPLPGRGVAWFTGTLYKHKVPQWHHDEYFLVATIFDLNRFPTDFGASNARSLGASMRRAVANGANEESTGRRLQILLDADFEEKSASELAFRARQIVQWLAGRQVGVDYTHLIADLCGWSHPDRHIQKKWAREFYDVRPFEPNN